MGFLWIFSTLAASSVGTESLMLTALVPQKEMLRFRSKSVFTHRQCWMRHFSHVNDDKYGTNNAHDDLVRERNELNSILESVDSVRSLVANSTLLVRSLNETDNVKSLTLEYDRNVTQLEQEIARLTVTPIGISREDYTKAIWSFLRLPLFVRVAMCEALEYENSISQATDWRRVPDIVTKICERQSILTPSNLKDAVERSRQITEKILRSNSKSRAMSSSSTSLRNDEDVSLKKLNEQRTNKLRSFGDTSVFSQRGESARSSSDASSLYLGRLARIEKRVVTKNDLDVLIKMLTKDTFVASGTDKISCGYVVRGQNMKKNPDELLKSLDDKRPKNWECEVCYMPDIFSSDARIDGSSDHVLVLLNKDLSPSTSRWVLSFATSAAIISSLAFGFGVYGANEAIAERFTDQSDLALDYMGQFNFLIEKVTRVISPLAATQVLHEIGHFLVAWRDKLKLCLPPTLLPAWNLPFQGTQLQLKESPRSLLSLFDFAFAGPLLGSIASLALLIYGLNSAASADVDTLQYLPSLPVSVIKTSTLGSTIFDYFFGGQGMITLLNPETRVPLHPYAIAGFLGMLVNALELLPLGSTDGGRLSLSIFGRQGHFLIGALVWVALLCSSLLLDNSNILLGAWIVYSFSQNDPEIPCRDEIEKVDLFRSFAAFSLWLYAIFVIVPLH